MSNEYLKKYLHERRDKESLIRQLANLYSHIYKDYTDSFKDKDGKIKVRFMGGLNNLMGKLHLDGIEEAFQRVGVIGKEETLSPMKASELYYGISWEDIKKGSCTPELCQKEEDEWNTIFRKFFEG